MAHSVRFLAITLLGLLLMSATTTHALRGDTGVRGGDEENTGGSFDASATGQIVGTVQCFDGSIPDAATVYIPGISVMARTTDAGEFHLFMVPEGTHALRVEVTGQERLPITDVSQIVVGKQDISDVGTVQLACPEVCDGLDNNGNTQIDEGLGCGQSGEIGEDGDIAGSLDFSCGSQGLSKCGNACIDTSLDPKNCGACGNTCSASEVCFSARCVSPLVR